MKNKTLNKSLIKLEFQILSSWWFFFVCAFLFYFSDEFILKGVFDFNMPLFWYWNEKNMKILKSFSFCKVKCVLHLLLKSNLINFIFHTKNFPSKWQVSVTTFSLDLIHIFPRIEFQIFWHIFPYFLFFNFLTKKYWKFT